MTENLPNLVKEIDTQAQNLKRPTPRHIIIKMSKVTDKERILKAARGKLLITTRELL